MDVPVLLDSAYDAVNLLPARENRPAPANVSHIGEHGAFQSHKLVDDLRTPLQSLNDRDS